MEEQPRILGEVTLERLLQIQGELVSANGGPEALAKWLKERGLSPEVFTEFLTIAGQSAGAALLYFSESEDATPTDVLGAIYAGAFEMGVRYAEEMLLPAPPHPYVEI